MDCARGVVFSPRAFFYCLKQDLQDLQDGQDERQVREALNVYRHQQECGEKVWKTLMSIEFSRKQEDKVR